MDFTPTPSNKINREINRWRRGLTTRWELEWAITEALQSGELPTVDDQGHHWSASMIVDYVQFITPRH